jgi:hypothetical protein
LPHCSRLSRKGGNLFWWNLVKWRIIKSIVALVAHSDLQIFHPDEDNFLKWRFSCDNLMVFHLLAMTVKSVICKALHNLKQALRTWYFKINTYFKPQGLQRSSADHNLYFLHEMRFY